MPALIVLLTLGACSVDPVCREPEKARVEAVIASRTDALGVTPDRTLSLAECEEIAVKNNLAYRVTLLETQLEDEDVRAALASLLPRGTVEFTRTARTNDPTITGPAGGTGQFEDRDMSRFRTGILIPIFDFGATQMGWEIAKDERTQQRLLAARARQTLLRDVRVAYVGLLGALADADLLESLVAAAREELRVARSLEREGLGTGADTAFVDAAVARSELELTSAGHVVSLSRTALSRTLSLPTWTEYHVEPTVDADPQPPVGKEGIAALEQAALRSRPELWVQDLGRHIAATEVRARFAEFFPRLGGTAEFEWSSNSLLVNPSFYKGGVVIAHTLLEGGATIARYRKAQGQVRVEQERALLVGISVLYEVDLRVLELIKAHDKLNASEKVVMAQEALLARVRASHREGLESGADLTRALAGFHAAKRGLNATRTELLTAWFELDAAVGADSGIAPILPASRPESEPTRGEHP